MVDYGWTCGSIDDNIKDIKDIKDIIESHLSEMLDNYCPLLEGEQKTEFITDNVNYIYSECEGIFEDLRDCNSDMRKEADNQIDDLEEERDQLKYQIDDLENKVDELEKTIKNLQNEE